MAKKKPAKKKVYQTASAVAGGGVALVEDDRGRALLQLRSRLGMSREVFARLLPTSVRNLANVESGQAPSATIVKSLTELRRAVKALEGVVQKDAVGPWLAQPNNAFGGLKPIEVIERGEIDRIWQMVFHLQNGDAF